MTCHGSSAWCAAWCTHGSKAWCAAWYAYGSMAWCAAAHKWICSPLTPELPWYISQPVPPLGSLTLLLFILAAHKVLLVSLCIQNDITITHIQTPRHQKKTPHHTNMNFAHTLLVWPQIPGELQRLLACNNCPSFYLSQTLCMYNVLFALLTQDLSDTLSGWEPPTPPTQLIFTKLFN